MCLSIPPIRLSVQIDPDGRSVFYQQVNAFLSNDTDFLLPWYIAAEGGEFINGTQCMNGGTNQWGANHAALASGQNVRQLVVHSLIPESLPYRSN